MGEGAVASALPPDASPAEVAAVARSLYPEGPFLMRLMQRWRPYICPFGPLIDQVPADASVLDVGCGGGLFLGLLRAGRRLREGLGFDASRPAIAIAQAMAARGGSDAPSITFER
jgi:2-polyprenyl-3-methyl-5-hydroxy-6-metoxy-1,4-benzoquinol methylase